MSDPCARRPARAGWLTIGCQLTYGCAPVDTSQNISGLRPVAAAQHVVASHAHDPAWLDAFAAAVDRYRAGNSLARTMRAWGGSQAEAARLFGVSRQAVGKWLRNGPPVERAIALADLAAATDLLLHYLKPDRIPAVVRRPVPALGGLSLTDLLTRGDTAALLDACRDMFAFERVST